MLRKLLFLFVLFLMAAQVMNAQTHYGTGADNSLTVASGDVFVIDMVRSPLVGDNIAGTNMIEVADGTLFHPGDEVLVITMVDPETDMNQNTVGQFETRYVSHVFGNMLFLQNALNHDFVSSNGAKHQVIKVYNYTDVTVNGEITCSNWDGSTGGVLIFRASGSLNISSTGKITVDGKGYRGHDRQSDNQNGYQGEGIFGVGVQSTAANGNGGGGGLYAYGGGAGGGYANAGAVGTYSNQYGIGGLAVGDSTLTKLYMGGAGGTGGDNDSNNATNPNGGFGGGIILIAANQVTNFGILSANGGNGQYSNSNDGGAGGGAGGSILLQSLTFQNDSSLLAEGGIGYNGSNGDGGNGSVGRIRIVSKTLANTGSYSPLAFEDAISGIMHIPFGNIASPAMPINLNAIIVDEQGNTITNAYIYYRINNGTWNTVNMTAGTGDSFSGTIPTQPQLSQVDYYLKATDGSDNYYMPNDAPTSFFSFEVNGYPPSGLTITDTHTGPIQLDWEAPTTAPTNYKVYRSQVENFITSPVFLLTTTTDTFFVDNAVNDFYTYFYKVAANYGSYEINSEEASILVNNHNLTTVKGEVFLEGQSNHANVKVKFIPMSPSAVLDSTYTDALGYFETTINPGIYEVTYEKVNFQSYVRETNFSIIDDHDFGQSTLLQMGTTISGNVSGTWNGLYTIDGNITVPNGDTLIVEAGSEIRFLGNYYFRVYGYLMINGVEGDSVLVTSAPYNQIQEPGQWLGFDFMPDCDDNSAMNYVKVEYAYDGVYVEESNMSVNHCKVSHCSNSGMYLKGSTVYMNIFSTELYNNYDGIYNYYGRPEIDDMHSHHNTRYGAFWEYYAYGNIRDSKFNNNASHGMKLYNRANVGVYDTEIEYNGSWGVRTDYYSEPRFERCDVSYNTDYGLCIGYNGNGWHTPRIIDCLVEGNSSWGILLRYYLRPNSEIRGNTVQNNGGGIYIYYQIDAQIYDNKIIGNNSIGIYFDNNHYSEPHIHHNVIAYNNGDGIHRDGHEGSAYIHYNTIYGNNGDGIENNQTAGSWHVTNNIITNNAEWGLRANKAIGTFEYNNIYSNGLGEITGASNLPVNSWNFVSFNAQNDSADIYLNISEDPLFWFDADSADLQLTQVSPCVNTGDPSVKDPDQTDSDMGALYFDMAYPHQLYVDDYGDGFVTLSWDSIEIDSLLSYNIYYKLHSATSYTMFGNAAGLSTDVTGLTNDSLYDFTVAGVYPNHVSAMSPSVLGTPGMPGIAFNPESFNLTITTDTLMENLVVSNNGSRSMHIEIPQGMDNGAIHFDGDNDYLYKSDPAAMEGMTAMTIEIWVNRENDGHIEFFGKHYRQWSMYIGSDNTFGMYKGYTSDWYDSYGSGWEVPANEWHHLAISWEGNDMWFYADGQLVNHNTNVMSNAIPNLGYYFGLGTRAHDWTYDFQGFLSEARVWNYVRSQEQIQRYMYSTLETPQTGLIGYWPLKSNYNDVSGSGLNLSESGHTYFSDSQIAYDVIPYYLPNGESYDIAAGSNISIPFGFLNTGQTGTYLYTQHIFTNIPNNMDVEYEMALTFGQTVPATPVHFTPVASTGLPYTLVITDAIVDENTIAVGDEIGVYDGNLCVGAGIFDGNFNFVITVWEADPGNSLPGFTPGNTMGFVIYDTSADLEAPSDATYTVGDGTFGYEEFSALSLNGTVYQIQEVPVDGGMFNLISFNLLPRYSEAATVFGDLADMQIVYNDAGNAIIPPYNINTMGDVYFKDGYHIFTNSDDTILFEGTVIDPLEWPILVEAGKWNSVAFLGDSWGDVPNVFDSTVVDSIAIVQASNGTAWIPGLGINTLNGMVPGKGYQIALNSQSDIEVIFRMDLIPAKQDYPVLPTAEYFEFEKTGLPYQIVVETPVIDGQRLLPGDEVAVYDGDVCVGAAVVNGQSRVLVTAWEGDTRTKLNGFEKGNDMGFRIYSAQHGEMICSANGMNDKDNEHFKAADYAHVELEPVSEINNLFSCYPNPFEENTTISIYIEEDANVEIQVLDLSGRIVKVIAQETLPAGEHNFTWNGNDTYGDAASSGVYFIEYRNGTESKTEKLIRIK